VDVVFTTSSDTTPPTVSSVAPVSGATNVNVNANVTVTFSEAMNASTISSSTIELRNPSNALILSTVSYNATTFTATLDPNASLAAGTTYTGTVRGGAADPRVKDAAGNALANNHTWSFTTASGQDTTPPTVSSVAPVSGATGVNVDANVAVTFSEAMNASTVNTSTIELRNPSNALISAAVTYNASTFTATLDPTAALADGVTYTLRVRGGGADPRVKDLAGNALATDATSTFTTAVTVNCIASVPTTSWKGEYFNNIALSGSPPMVRPDGTGFLNFNFGDGGPGGNCGLGVDNFSARWTRTVNFAAGVYRFSVTVDDGVRLYVDGQLKIDKWFPQGATTYTADVTLSAGLHDIKLEYFESGGPGVALLSWWTVVNGAAVNCLPNVLISNAPRSGAGDSIATNSVSETPKRCSQKISD
jgi:hypothetical protein